MFWTLFLPHHFFCLNLPFQANKQIADMKTELSILIPVYNETCVDNIKAIKELCDKTEALQYEILVADDRSTDAAAIAANRQINQMEHCRFIEKERNEGSAATRNFLAAQSRYEWLLFLDCDMEIQNPHFIKAYMECMKDGQVVNGGIKTGAYRTELKHNLRYLYERKAEASHTAAQRNKTPYQSFRSANFMIPKSLFTSIRFNEKMRRYEDVYFGRQLKQHGASIIHIDNPVIMEDYEDNDKYMKKFELDAHTLHAFRNELRGYSRLLALAEKIEGIPVLYHMIKLWHKAFGKFERKRLIGKHPGTFLLSIYRVGYFLCVT